MEKREDRAQVPFWMRLRRKQTRSDTGVCKIRARPMSMINKTNRTAKFVLYKKAEATTLTKVFAPTNQQATFLNRFCV